MFFLHSPYNLHLLLVKNFIIVRHAIFLSTLFLLNRLFNFNFICRFGLWRFSLWRFGLCLIDCCIRDYFASTMFWFGWFYHHGGSSAPIMVFAAISQVTNNLVRGITLVNPGPVMVVARLIFFTDFNDWGSFIPIMIMAAWTINADYFLPTTSFTMQLKVLSVLKSKKVGTR